MNKFYKNLQEKMYEKFYKKPQKCMNKFYKNLQKKMYEKVL